ncbi:response regulator transcription factor [Streptomyces sp. AC602_WCS936]|uniref:response regulator transcription factor n=1 Tax=Streptomyces sp. AC602_WCS936 TaxID=2823685 RepID=UPI001C251A27|nr:response regulator transcription factor [Streptomyces sp. AC602_WCS936]
MTEPTIGFARTSVLRVLPGAAAAARGVRLFLVGPDALARAGIRSLLDGRGDITVVGEDEPGPRALAAVRAHEPDVLLAHGLRDEEESDALLRAVGADGAVLTVGGVEPPERPAPALRGHLPVTAGAEQLAAAVSLAAAGYSMARGPLAPAAPPARGAGTTSVSTVPPDRLTDREHQILDLVSRGLSNTEIARSLTLSEHTVKTHVQNLLQKLRLRNRVHVAIYAFESGLR